jgi:orotate phosphoribosyltransferase
VARALGVRAIFAERQEGALTLRRGFALSPDDRVVVIEDVVTTGGSTRETMAVAAAAGAQVTGAGAVIDRSGGNSNLGVPFHALVSLTLATYQPDTCPMCAAREPLVKPGSRAS